MLCGIVSSACQIVLRRGGQEDEAVELRASVTGHSILSAITPAALAAFGRSAWAKENASSLPACGTLPCSSCSNCATLTAIPAPFPINRLQPRLQVSVMRPGTANTSFPCSNAISTVISVPLFSRASITSTRSESALMIRLRGGNSRECGSVPGGYSDRIHPFSHSLSYSGLFSSG